VSAETWVSLITGGVGAVTVLAVWLTTILAGKEHTDGEFKREVARGDRLEKALEDMTKAKGVSDERADTAVRATALVAEAFTKAAAQRKERARRGGTT
jgi:acyl-ACP thioesterase